MPERPSLFDDPVVRAALRLVRGDCPATAPRCCEDCGAPTPGSRFRLCERDRARRKLERQRHWWHDNGQQWRAGRRATEAVA